MNQRKASLNKSVKRTMTNLPMKGWHSFELYITTIFAFASHL